MLEFDAVTKRFGVLAALDVCTFTAQPGRLTGFLGPNGAGKTTAMRAVFGLVELDAGEVRWRGAPIGPVERARFGYMPEERGLYPRMHVRDQLVYLGRLCGSTEAEVSRSVDSWLERLGLADRASDRLDALSHGNQQRVQLIAALVNEPDLLVLDEPFAGLDPIAIDNMGELLAEIATAARRCCSPAISSISSRTCATTLSIIDHGRIVLAGELTELRAAVPQRFMDIHYRGATPDWSALGCSGAHRVDGRLRPTTSRTPTPTWRRSLLSLDGLQTSFRSPTNHRRCRNCSVRRWRHERRAPGLARRGSRDARTKSLPGLPRFTGRDGRCRRRRDHPAFRARAAAGARKTSE